MKKKILYVAFIRLIEIIICFCFALIQTIFSSKSFNLNYVQIYSDLRFTFDFFALRFVFFDVIHIPVLFYFVKEKTIVLMTSSTFTYLILSICYYFALDLPKEFFNKIFLLSCCLIFCSPFIANYLISFMFPRKQL